MVNVNAHRYRSKLITAIVMLIVCSTILQGCLYPKELHKGNQGAAKDGVFRVQHAVEQYQKEKEGMLPIVTAGETTPRYEKFIVDFRMLKKAEVLDEVPVNAFESGGTDTYIILNEETNPTIRLMDVMTAQRVNDLQRMVELAQRKQGQVPKGEQLYPGYYLIPLKDIGAGEAVVKSPYSGLELTFMVDESGRVYVDYAQDIMQLVARTEQSEELKQLPDMRTALVDAGLYSPIKSVAYVWNNDAPVPVLP